MTTQILDPTPVVKQQSSTSSSSSSSCHGELFYATFKSTITQLLITVADDAVKHLTADDANVEQRRPVIASVITSMLDVVGRDSHLRHRYVHWYLIAISTIFSCIVYCRWIFYIADCCQVHLQHCRLAVNTMSSHQSNSRCQ